MPFDATSTYNGAIAAGDTGSANLMNSLYMQATTLALRPDVGNAGVVFAPTDFPGVIQRDSGSTWNTIIDTFVEGILYG